MDLITVREAAEELGLSIRRVHQLIVTGRLRATKIGSYYVIRRRDLADVAFRKPGRPARNRTD